MTILTTTPALAAFCRSLAGADFLTVDTEFLRDTTYYSRLCLIQVAGPGAVAAIDPLAPELDLAPLWELLFDPAVLKVFHAARNDLEIVFHMTGRLPAPAFDTQIAAMACGFGESVSYDTLVQRLARTRIEKDSRFSDWARRPLTEKQLAYALADVTHLRVVYKELMAQLEESGRLDWLADEMAALTDPATYRNDPREAWRRIRVRTDKPRVLAVLREIAAWREEEAQKRDVPRTRVLKDEALADLAVQAPRDAEALSRMRGLPQGFATGRWGREVLDAVARGLAVPPEEMPSRPPRPDVPASAGAAVDLLKVLLKLKAEETGIAPRLIANSADIERLASEEAPDIPALSGWRRDAFGAEALALKRGEVGLALHRGRLTLVRRARPGASDAAAG